MPRPNRVTLEVISKELNLSTSSVSRALRNDPLIHPETRARVNTIASKLGYQGRSRRGPQKTAKQRGIRVLFAVNSLTDIKTGVITMAYLQGITSAAEGAGLNLHIHTVPPDGSTGKKGSSTNSSLPEHHEGDAMIIIGRHDPARVASLAQTFPVVSLVRSYEGIKHDFVSTDDFHGISQLVKKLTDFGHRQMAWISLEERSSYARTRRAGFLEGCFAAGLDLSQQEFIQGAFDGFVLSKPELIFSALKKGVTAFVAASDHAAYEISEALARENIVIPDQISITGFDAVGEPGHQSPKFTSYDPRFVEMGRAAVQQAVWRLENLSAAPLQITVKGQLVDGNTVGPAAKGKKGK